MPNRVAMYLRPKTCATMPDVNGTVDSQRMPIVAANRYIVVGIFGASINEVIAIARNV